MSEGDGREPVGGRLPLWPKIYQKKLPDPNRWMQVTTLPSDVHHWRMSLMGERGKEAPDTFVKVAFEEAPGDDMWFPLFQGVEPAWRHHWTKAIYAQPYTTGPGDSDWDIVVVEAWLSKMPAEYADREKSKLGTIGSRQK